MGSSEFGAINCMVGTIVWVRRRNGSWWPGRILGQEELSASHLMSPRSGTPVKLLGREDASVDWYNLEKSKRVKAFRCGEFNDCIERAESSHGIRSKKREKYARREDAILHALELEKQSVEKKHSVVGIVSECRGSTMTDSMKRDFAFAPKKSSEKGKCVISKSQQSYRTDFSYKDKSKVIAHGFQNSEEINKLRYVDDSSEPVPRMRYLQDFGRKNCSILSNDVSSSNAYATSLLDKNKRDSKGLVNDESLLKKRKRQTGVVYRAKRSKCIYVQPHSNDSRGSPKMKISPSCTIEGNCEPRLDTLMEGNSCQHSSNNESNYSQAECLNPETDEVVSPMLDSGGLKDEECVASEYRNLNRDHLDCTGFTGEIGRPQPQTAAPCGGEGMSKWKLKGKRNIRGLSKRLDTRLSTPVSPHRVRLEEIGRPLCTRATASRWSFSTSSSGLVVDETDRIFENRDTIGGEIEARAAGFDGIDGCCLRPGNSIGWSEEDWEPCWSHNHGGFADWNHHHHHYHHHHQQMGSLFEVDLRVQTSYQRGQVPIVSLMSRLNGKAIVGHPIQITLLKDGSAEASERVTGPDSTPLPSAWRTARRTPNRIRRPGKSSPVEGRVVKKMQKKEGSFGQKTRTLSSIAAHQPGGGGQEMKRVGSVGLTAVACVPVKLVFSRLFEGISRPPP